MKRINISENGINMVFEVTDEQQLLLLHFSCLELDEATLGKPQHKQAFQFLELNVSGLDRPYERHGNKYIVTAPGYRMTFKGIEDTRNEQGRVVKVSLEDKETGLETVTDIQFYDGVSVARFITTVTNNGSEVYGLDYVSSFNLSGIEKEGKTSQEDKLEIYIPHNSWYREMQWRKYSLHDLGMDECMETLEQHSSKPIRVSNVGNWSTKEFLPMALIRNSETDSNLFFQIENNGSWHWEISDSEGHLYLAVSGPNEIYSHWYKELKTGESFTTVPVAVGTTKGSFETAFGELTKYRRKIRRPNTDNDKLPVIFNDYMNCLWSNPTEEAEYPLIDAASEVGCEYFCIDAGWYSDGYWWDSVGEWKESKKRFPHGLKSLTDYIRSKGMIPGIWIELEVMGINCPLAKEVPDDWFFCRHGKRAYDRSRYQLDFRNPEVIKFADETIKRLVDDYGVGYLKIDYNIEPGIGTDVNADSFGDGLLGHERAYIAWLKKTFEKYPELIIENCSSGGMRIDYALLSQCSIQSVSDQADYKYNCVLAANSPSALTPEQAAIWSYPMTEADDENVVFNIVNSILLRIHQSGHLAKINPSGRALVKEGISVYKTIREDIKNAVPFWSLGFGTFQDDFLSLGLDCGDKAYIAVWRKDGEDDSVILPLGFSAKSVRCIYPSFNEWEYSLQSNSLEVELKKPYSARLFEIEK
ncbi:MAG: alpha-galactosidase [Ruminococcus sp.]|nr:alpha-galactosidase [Ruminococcus sp.]